MLKLLACLIALPLAGADFQAGVARLKITPEAPVRVAGDLWAKALAVEDAKGHRVVIVTTDLIGLPRSITDPVAARTGLDRAQLVFSSSNTHSGPVLRGSSGYSVKLADSLVTVIGAALGDLKPAVLAYGEGAAEFGVNPTGPRDTAVPVLKVAKPDGTLLAVLFGYACRNTTVGGDFFQISGDYAGFAQLELEKKHPGSVALFIQLCGADANPNPRGTLALAQQHGRTLAAQVDRVLSSPMMSVRGPIRGAFRIVEPKFAPHLEEGRPIRRIPYPVQAIRFGKSLTLVALGGEVVADYALRIKREYRSAKEPIIVAGYSNDVMGYIPHVDGIEETIFTGIHSVMKRVGK